MFRLFLTIAGAEAVARTPASMRRVSKVCFWSMLVFLLLSIIPLILIVLIPMSNDAPGVLAIFIGGITLPLTGYSFLGWIYFAFLSWVARA